MPGRLKQKLFLQRTGTWGLVCDFTINSSHSLAVALPISWKLVSPRMLLCMETRMLFNS